MKRKVISLLCSLCILSVSFIFPLTAYAESNTTYDPQVTNSSSFVYGPSITTNMYAGCINGFAVQTDKSKIEAVMDFTDEEKYNGGEATLYVGFYSWDTTEKKAIDKVISQFGGSLVCLLDVQLFKYNGQENIAYPEPGISLDIVAEIPEKYGDGNSIPLYVDNRDFAFVRVHNGEVEVLKDQDSDIKTITFSTDKFSVYGLVYAPAGNIDAYLNNPDSTVTPVSNTGVTTSNDLDDVPKTGDIAWEIELSVIKPSSIPFNMFEK